MKKLNFKIVWSMFMTLVFLCMSVLLIFTEYFSSWSLPYRILFGVIFLVYSVFRGHQIWNELKG